MSPITRASVARIRNKSETLSSVEIRRKICTTLLWDCSPPVAPWSLDRMFASHENATAKCCTRGPLRERDGRPLSGTGKRIRRRRQSVESCMNTAERWQSSGRLSLYLCVGATGRRIKVETHSGASEARRIASICDSRTGRWTEIISQIRSRFIVSDWEG